MKNFSDYNVADITEQSREEITKLEDRIKQETGKEVVLIAYQEK